MDAVARDLIEAPRVGIARQVATFAQHYLEMCISMCVVGTPIILAFFVWGPGALGYADPREQFPALSVLSISVIYALPMVAWMRFRGMEWRPIAEMAGATVGVGVVLVALAFLGILSGAGLRQFASPSFCTPACVVMFLAMLPRLDLYTGRTGHHTGRHAHPGHAA